MNLNSRESTFSHVSQQKRKTYCVGSLIVIGEIFVVQMVDHGSFISEMPLRRDFSKETMVREI